MTIPASTILDPRPDDGGRGEHRGAHLSLVREESPAVKSFSEIPTMAKPLRAFETTVAKPLGAFEALPDPTAPLPWGSARS
jgi:hypothetical protein